MEQAMNRLDSLGIEDKMLPFFDFGFPKETIDKIAKLENEVNTYKISELTNFDAYEKIMINEFIKMMY